MASGLSRDSSKRKTDIRREPDGSLKLDGIAISAQYRQYVDSVAYNVVSCLGNIVVPNETRIIAEQDTVIIVT